MGHPVECDTTNSDLCSLCLHRRAVRELGGLRTRDRHATVLAAHEPEEIDYALGVIEKAGKEIGII